MVLPTRVEARPTTATGLEWGRAYLMCPPTHFRVAYEINPWMHTDVEVDGDRAHEQWHTLRALLEQAGATVCEMVPQPGLPDMVFTANAGTVVGTRAVPARFAHRERRGETDHDRRWFAREGFEVADLPSDVCQEGAGDALPAPGTRALVAGHGIRSTRSGVGVLARSLGIAVHPVRLVDPRLYHLDLAYCPLDTRRAMVVPGAFDVSGRRTLERLVPEPLLLEDVEAVTFCANSLVVGDVVVMPACPPRVGRWLEGAGFDVAVVDTSEFMKAGGACRCLTLPLDIGVVEASFGVAA